MITSTDSKNKYFMEDPREKQRLADKVEPSAWVERYVSPLVDDQAQVLDVGCGSAVLAREVAKLAAHVTGLEQSDDRFAEAEQNLASAANAEVVQGTATGMQFDDDQYDLVYTRFMLEYLKEREQAIAEMVRVCRPGGRVMLQDLDGQLLWHYPMESSLLRAIERVVGALAETGFDPFLGRKLFHMAKQAGLEDISVTCEPYHFYVGEMDDHNYELWDLKLEIALPMITLALGSEEQSRRSQTTVHGITCAATTRSPIRTCLRS